MYAYSLTGLTGRRKNAERTAVIPFFVVEVNRYTVIVIALSAGAGALVAAAVAGILALVGVFTFWVVLPIPVLFGFAGYFLFDTTARTGLQLRRANALRDKHLARLDTNTVLVCDRPLEPAQLGTLIPGFITTTPTPVTPVLGVAVRHRQGGASINE